ncbi:MAG: 16S rRNA (uracil(1498)-N(3))-methyltransferase [Cryomorphaceae bacterium]
MFYFLNTSFDINAPQLNEDEGRHAIKSLRLDVGDEILVGDGRGNRYTCRITGVDKKKTSLSVIETETFKKPESRLTIAIAPTKNPSRMEWFAEKATEMGVDEIIPIQTSRTERPRLKADRMERIVLAASKQSRRSFIPVIRSLTPFQDLEKETFDSKIIAHCEDGMPKVSLAEILSIKSGKVLIAIGPEGDFTRDEIEHALQNRYSAADLGSQRLRTETAGIYSAAVFASLFNEKM